MTVPPVLRRVVKARCPGPAVVPLGLEYRTDDPVAVSITAGRCLHRRTWHVARAVLDTALTRGGDIADDNHCRVAEVHVWRLSDTGRVAIVLRSALGRWPVTVAAADLAEFLRVTYHACPSRREAQIVSAALDAHCRQTLNAHEEGTNPA